MRHLLFSFLLTSVASARILDELNLVRFLRLCNVLHIEQRLVYCDALSPLIPPLVHKILDLILVDILLELIGGDVQLRVIDHFDEGNRGTDLDEGVPELGQLGVAGLEQLDKARRR